MSKKVMRMIVQQVEVKRSLLFYATGVTAYVTAHFMYCGMLILLRSFTDGN